MKNSNINLFDIVEDEIVPKSMLSSAKNIGKNISIKGISIEIDLISSALKETLFKLDKIVDVLQDSKIKSLKRVCFSLGISATGEIGLLTTRASTEVNSSILIELEIDKEKQA